MTNTTFAPPGRRHSLAVSPGAAAGPDDRDTYE